MREFLYRLVQRLHDEARPLSRNKHFHAFGDAESRRALHIDRHLRDLEARLSELRERGERPRVRPLPDGGVQLVLRHRELSVVRTATLSAQEVSAVGVDGRYKTVRTGDGEEYLAGAVLLALGSTYRRALRRA